MMIDAIILVRTFLISTSIELRYLANVNAVANLANSDGCNLNEPMDIHDVAPLVTEAVNSTTTSKTSMAPYIKYAVDEKNLESMISINIAVTKATAIQISCLPCCREKSIIAAPDSS